MRALPKWIEKNTQAPVQSICFSVDGSYLITAAGDRILVYDPNTGALIETLKGHKDVVNCVASARDGKKFASASADKTVIIWTSKFEGLVKYSHSDSVLCLAFNPVSHQLASGAVSDFAFWSTELKAVQKHKVPSKVCSCSWTNDGQYLALGLSNGVVSIRNKAGEEKSRIERPGSCPIFGVSWSPPATGLADTLCVVDWSKSLSFYNLGGQIIGKERSLNFDPLCLSYFPDGEYLATAGCNKQVQVFTKDGIRLGTLGDEQEAWIWTIAIHPQGNSIVLGCQDGSLIAYNVAFSTVHALYSERYAFRENMCDVIIQHLSSGQKVRIKCRDLVHKIAIYRNRLAVQLPERVVLYEMNSPDSQPMHYRVNQKISKKFECSLLVVCNQHLVLCQDKKLQSLDFTGKLQREWNMDSYIRYIKVTGGPPGREGLLLGLKSGEVWRIFLDNALPILVTTVLSAVRCLDVNCSRNKIAVVDDMGRLVVRDLLTDTMLYTDTAVNSVAWNTHMDDMVCYSHTGGGLSVRVGSLPPRSPQNMQGVVVGLSGATAFCLRGNYMSNVPLALGATMWQFVEAGLFEEASQVASLGVPASDWEGLANAALGALQLNVARRAFVKLRNLPWLTLLNELEERQKFPDNPKEVVQADILAFSGKFREAARLYQKCGQGTKALSMYSDLKMFELAQEFIRDENSADKKELVRLRAEWACSMHEPRAAAELLLSAGESQRAIEIVAAQGWTDVLLDIGRRLNASTESSALTLVATKLRRLKALPLAVEIYRKLGAESEVVELHIEARDWEEAFRLAKNQPELQSHVHLQHGLWLLETDDFIGAHRAFVSAGKAKEATELLLNLANSAISEKRFLDASYYNWLQAKQIVQFLETRGPSAAGLENDVLEFERLQKLANIYYAYDALHKYLQEPFTNNPTLTLFNISRYVANHIEKDVAPKGVSLFTVLYTLAKQAESLGANKLNFQIHNKLRQLKPPEGLYDQVAIKFISSRASPGGFNDPEELLPMCYKCSNYSSHLHGNRCPSCEQSLIFSFVSFEVLPLVDFSPEPDIPESEVERLLMAPPKSNEMHPDAFTDIMVHEELNVEMEGPLDRDALRMIDPRSVIMVKWPKPFKTRYYRNLIPDLLITVCPECFQAFHSEDFELQVLQKGHCPFCRTPADKLPNCY